MNRTIRLNGKDYEVAYSRRSRREIEQASKKGLYECLTQGMLEDHAVLIWAGLTHKYSSLKIAKVVDMIETDVEYGTAFKRCVRSLLELSPFGEKMDPALLERIAGSDEEDEREQHEGEASDSGKASPVTPQGG